MAKKDIVTVQDALDAFRQTNCPTDGKNKIESLLARLIDVDDYDLIDDRLEAFGTTSVKVWCHSWLNHFYLDMEDPVELNLISGNAVESISELYSS